MAPDAKVALIVDSDCDGYTSGAIIYQYLKIVYPELNIVYFLHKGKAHGLEEHWEEIAQGAFDAVIIPDAGSNDSKYAAEINCPIVVLDHHLVDNTEFAPNLIIINNQLSDNYRNKNLSGAGVTYQFCRALDYYCGKNDAYQFIDLAALGICGDMMSGLELENQYFWHEGFANLNNTFITALAEKQSYSITGQTLCTPDMLREALNPTSVAFYIVPLINAMIRTGAQEEKERMFLAFIDGKRLIPSQKRGAKGTMDWVANESVRECVNARSRQNKLKDTIVEKMEQQIFKYDLLENKILFIRLDDDDDFPSELNGLIAMQLSQKYHRPTIVARLNSDGYVRGSIRGLNDSALESFKDYLDQTGLCEYVQGHDNAAGVSILNSNLSHLHELANADFAQYDFGEKYYNVDFERQATSADLSELIAALSDAKFVWSQQNSEPLIHITDLHFCGKDVQVMGKNHDTVKIVKNGVAYMKFFAKDLIEELAAFDTASMEVVGKANINEWGGRITPQVFIEGYELKKYTNLDF